MVGAGAADDVINRSANKSDRDLFSFLSFISFLFFFLFGFFVLPTDVKVEPDGRVGDGRRVVAFDGKGPPDLGLVVVFDRT